MYYLKYAFNYFSLCLENSFFNLYLFDICYFMQEPIETVVLEEQQSEVVVNPPLPPNQVHVCFAFFGNIIFRPCSIYVSDSLFYLKLTYMLLYVGP